MGIPDRLAELCVETYIQAVYYKDSDQIKMDTGMLIEQLISNIEKSDKKLISYTI